MELVLILLLLVVSFIKIQYSRNFTKPFNLKKSIKTGTVVSNSSCDPWPENLKPLRECCNIPHHSNTILMNHCYFKCNTSDKDGDQQNDCAAKCYTNFTLLITDDKLNKNVVKRIYGGNAFYEEKWMKLINGSVDNCDFDESGPLVENLAKFFECINLQLENNCASFTNSIECDKVQEYFEQCNNIKPDCEVWPQTVINPDVCCKTPPVFSQRHINTCRQKSLTKELFLPRQIKYMESCLFNETNIKVDGKFDFAVLQKLLIANTKENPEWEKPITEAIEKCEKKMKGLIKIL